MGSSSAPRLPNRTIPRRTVGRDVAATASSRDRSIRVAPPSPSPSRKSAPRTGRTLSDPFVSTGTQRRQPIGGPIACRHNGPLSLECSPMLSEDGSSWRRVATSRRRPRARMMMTTTECCIREYRINGGGERGNQGTLGPCDGPCDVLFFFQAQWPRHRR